MRYSPLLAILLAACRSEKLETVDTSSPVELDASGADADADGYDTSEDCDDANSVINPGASEICDGVDNNCDGTVDEGVTTTFYADSDGDGFGDADNGIEACEQPSGFVPIGNDCDDTNDEVYPSAPEQCDGVDNDCDGEIDEDLTEYWYADADGDGYGDPDSGGASCNPKQGYVDNGEDCDDTNPTALPGGVEVCDGADNDCDGDVDEGVSTTYYEDIDADGYGDPDTTNESCDLPTGYSEDAGDCDDEDGAVNPAATEICDTIDNDCDGSIDESDAADAGTWYADVDNDGYGDPSSAIDNCEQPISYVSDNTDCDDAESAANPGESEVCDGVDNDCDGDTDEGVTETYYADTDSDGYGDSSTTTEDCSLPSGYAADATDCDDTEASVNPGAFEVCNEVDDDCDGSIDEGTTSIFYEDTDGDGYGDTSSTIEDCAVPSGYSADATDCDDDNASINPGETEICDELDNDCDGDTDEGAAAPQTWYADDDGDSFGDSDVTTEDCEAPSGYVDNGDDCDDGNNTISPDGTEVCNGEDDDCDGSVDEGVSSLDTFYADDDGDGFGDPDDTTEACEAPSGYAEDDTDCDDDDADVNPDADEVCNEIDDDCDGDIDTDDADLDASTGDTYYADDDGDGFGDPDDTTEACEEPSGYTDDDNDCDDSTSSTNPDATEICDGEDNDCDGVEDNGVLGTGTACPAEDCTEILADDSTAADGDYELYAGTYTCDMTTDGGGWTLVGEAVSVYGTGYDTTYYNSEGFTWTETLFAYNSGSAHAHCTYPSSMTGCNNLGFQFASESWGVALNWGSSICGMSTTDYTGDTSYIGGYDFTIARSESTDTMRLGTLEGISNCTTSDNPGTAYVDILVRH